MRLTKFEVTVYESRKATVHIWVEGNGMGEAEKVQAIALAQESAEWTVQQPTAQVTELRPVASIEGDMIPASMPPSSPGIFPPQRTDKGYYAK